MAICLYWNSENEIYSQNNQTNVLDQKNSKHDTEFIFGTIKIPGLFTLEYFFLFV